MRLHHGMGLIRGGVGRIKLHRRGGEGTRKIADGRIWLAITATGRFGGTVPSGRQVERALRRVVVDLDKMGRGTGLLERFGDDDRDGLVIMVDLGAAEQLRRVVIALAELAGILGCDDRDDTRRGFGAGQIDRRDPALGDGRPDNVAVGRCRARAGVVPFMSVGCPPRRLERTVDPARRMPDDLELVDRIRGRGRIELHGSALRFGQHGGERALDQGQLECVIPRRPGTVEQTCCDGLGAAWHLGFRCLDPPRLVSDTSDGDTT
ncbi:hypothetical protein ACVWXO_010156 [Bradyrhizobium sp. LM2.7]